MGAGGGRENLVAGVNVRGAKAETKSSSNNLLWRSNDSGLWTYCMELHIINY